MRKFLILLALMALAAFLFFLGIGKFFLAFTPDELTFWGRFSSTTGLILCFLLSLPLPIDQKEGMDQEKGIFATLATLSAKQLIKIFLPFFLAVFLFWCVAGDFSYGNNRFFYYAATIATIIFLQNLAKHL